MELTNTNVRYLRTIYRLSRARLEVSSKDIACSLDASRASVTSMMGVLTDKQLVAKERYGKVHLTWEGVRLARRLSAQADALAANEESLRDSDGRTAAERRAFTRSALEALGVTEAEE